MKFKCLYLAFIHLTLLSLSVSAGTITDTNNDSFIDDSTGLEWMDFGINTGQTYNYVASQLGQGEEYEGWSLATSDQVYTMWANAFLGLGSDTERVNTPNRWMSASDGENVKGSVFDNVFDAMGKDFSHASGTEQELQAAHAWFEGSDGLSYFYLRRMVGETVDFSTHDFAYLNDSENWSDYADVAVSKYSTLLVRNAVNISEPATTIIFSLSLIGLFLSRKKKNQ